MESQQERRRKRVVVAFDSPPLNYYFHSHPLPCNQTINTPIMVDTNVAIRTINIISSPVSFIFFPFYYFSSVPSLYVRFLGEDFGDLPSYLIGFLCFALKKVGVKSFWQSRFWVNRLLL